MMVNNKKKVEIDKEEYERLIISNQELTQQISKLKSSSSYRLGRAFISSTKSWRDAFKLPVRIFRIFVDGWQRRSKTKIKGRLQTNNTLPQTKIALKSKHPLHKKDFHKLQQIFQERKKDGRLKVAAIMDEFTESSFFPECELLQLSPSSCIEQLSNFKPDFLFIESAWQGKDQLWKTVISNCKSQVIDAIDWCYENNTQTVFWNKEDPVHFSSFLEIARHVDHVFTTDVDCIPKYKAVLGHDRVYLLPFAAQPLYHNPIEKYKRKDAFNFAGSYYLRYPQRQADFKQLVEAAKNFKDVDIFDRNFNKDHPHYKFPEEYSDLILGTLPFSDIDKAYKGYCYGINMNTIKQSQSMFARRVFELLASNTVVISNYSRGVRAFFGDLVITSDKCEHILSLLNKYCKDEITYKKFRLLGMRKVLLDHTYSQRLSFIESKLSGVVPDKIAALVNVFCMVENTTDLEAILSSLSRQKHNNVKAHILLSSKDIQPRNGPNISYYTSELELRSVYEDLPVDAQISIMSSRNYYGAFYLTDMTLAKKYTQNRVITKDTRYSATNGRVTLEQLGSEYTFVKKFRLDVSLFNKQELQQDLIEMLYNPRSIYEYDAFSIDSFNLCIDYDDLIDKSEVSIVRDLNISNQGVHYKNISQIFNNEIFDDYKPKSSNECIKEISATELFSFLPKEQANIRVKLETGKFSLYPRLESGKHSYIYLNNFFLREELNLTLNSKFSFNSVGRLESIKSVFEFYDKDKQKISHQMNEINGGVHSLAIPNNCHYVKVGFRVQGSGKFSIKKLSLGDSVNIPSAVIGSTKVLSLSKQYPSYEDIYRYGFLHSRIKAYKECNCSVDVFRLSYEDPTPFREFEGIDIAQGDLALLDRTLATGLYEHVLVHMLDEKMWGVLEKHIDNIKVTVWAHGAEIQLWERRKFEFERLSKSEINRQKNLSKRRKLFWEGILDKPHPNLKMVFVSNYFKDEVLTDFDVSIPSNQVAIIHNYINGNDFSYIEKDARQRKKILSIRPYASRKYANDLTVKAILELSKKEFFEELEFCLVGDGVLFDELTAPLRKFENVELRKEFLTHRQIANLHKEYGVFLTPTRMDSQGVSRDEAMASGLVPITSNIAAIPEFMDESCGFLVEPESYIDLAKAIEDLYNDEKLFLKMSEKASQRVRAQSSFAATIKKEIELFSNEEEL